MFTDSKLIVTCVSSNFNSVAVKWRRFCWKHLFCETRNSISVSQFNKFDLFWIRMWCAHLLFCESRSEFNFLIHFNILCKLCKYLRLNWHFLYICIELRFFRKYIFCTRWGRQSFFSNQKDDIRNLNYKFNSIYQKF